MLTNGQKQALHSAARRLGPDFTEDLRRTVQWNLGGFYSAADKTATRQGYIAVMAFYEQELEKRRTASGAPMLLGKTRGYWGEELRKSTPEDALRYRVRTQAARLGWDEPRLNAWLAGEHMASSPGMTVGNAPAYWLWRASNGLAAILKRTA